MFGCSIATMVAGRRGVVGRRQNLSLYFHTKKERVRITVRSTSLQKHQYNATYALEHTVLVNTIDASHGKLTTGNAAQRWRGKPLDGREGQCGYYQEQRDKTIHGPGIKEGYGQCRGAEAEIGASSTIVYVVVCCCTRLHVFDVLLIYIYTSSSSSCRRWTPLTENMVNPSKEISCFCLLYVDCATDRRACIRHKMKNRVKATSAST